MRLQLLFSLLLTITSASCFAQNVAETTAPAASSEPTFKSSAKGFFSYKQNQTFENLATTTPFWKKSTDLNELSLTGEYYLTQKSEVEFEIEFEHGGAGTAMEYDALEEFGEFESEIEKGGEVVLSEFYYKYYLGHSSWLKAGKIPILISLQNTQENYFLYPTIHASLAESFMLPHEWREIGAEYHKMIDSWNFRAALVNGLNSEFFRKYNWVGGGYQNRFEGSNSGDLAMHFSAMYGDLTYGNGVALAGYYGNTTGNRYKQSKLQSDANVFLLTAMGSWQFGNWQVRGQYILGTLQNSDLVTTANSSLGNLANPGAFAALGSKAYLQQLEVSYKLATTDQDDWVVYAEVEKVDTMSEVAGNVFRDDRYNQLISSFGFLHRFETYAFVKGQVSRTSSALVGLPDTKAFQVALGFDLKLLNM